MASRKLIVNYILCSSYDDDGYPRRYWRGIFPSNTLGCLRTLTESLKGSVLIDPDLELEVRTYDDTIDRIPFKAIAREADANTTVLVGLAGVQTGQFVRATNLAERFRAQNIPVLVGGFHVSGSLAMLPETPPELQYLIDLGVSLIRGEAETPEALAGIFRDALSNQLKPIYTMPATPHLAEAPLPDLTDTYRKRFFSGRLAPLDTSRGCPFNCSFCTVINVLGHKMRHRKTERILETVRKGYDQGVRTYFFVDDNMARSPIWEEVFDGLIEMRQQGRDIGFLMQVDTLAYKIPNFVDKARDAGCSSVFIGMESIDPVNLKAVGKRQNRTDDYRRMTDTWRQAGIIIHVGYITGMPNDTPESIGHAVQTLTEEVGIDLASFFKLTPLPGSVDHRELVQLRTPLDADLNNYDSLHTARKHERMTGEQWDSAYDDAWASFYSIENITRILLRAPKRAYWSLFWMLVWYRHAMLSREHPMFSGYGRFKSRTERRPGMPIESRLRFMGRRIADTCRGVRRSIRLYLEFQEVWMLTRKRNDPARRTAADLRYRLAQASRQFTNATDPVLSTLRQSVSDLQALGGRLSGRQRRHALQLARQLRAWRLALAHLPEDAAQFRERAVLTYEKLVCKDLARRQKLTRQWRQLSREIRTGLPSLRRLAWTPFALILEIPMSIRFAIAFIRKPPVPGV
ncbi:radical SAM protein [Mucisphaera sp.]|uniref:B12-binding domain-containing radical SAM protein n=1 Tax=Mucisphaera sp. TaxID=2913024 RepID=UPI003D0DB691